MIWHVYAEEFLRFIGGEGFVLVDQTARSDIYERNGIRISIRRAERLTRQEVDIICDAADLNPPPMDERFGD